MDRPDGLYEELISESLHLALERAREEGRHVEREPVDPAEAHVVLGAALGRVLQGVLRTV